MILSYMYLLGMLTDELPRLKSPFPTPSGVVIHQIPRTDGTYDRKEFKKEYIKTMDQLDQIMNAKELPGLWDSISPILVPIVLILCKTVAGLTSLILKRIAPA